MTVALIAKKPFLYASRVLAVGDAFDASEQDAKILKHIGHADDAYDPQAMTDALQRTADSIKAGRYARRDLPSEPEEPVKIDRRTRAYRRRDLVPEP